MYMNNCSLTSSWVDRLIYDCVDCFTVGVVAQIYSLSILTGLVYDHLVFICCRMGLYIVCFLDKSVNSIIGTIITEFNYIVRVYWKEYISAWASKLHTVK